MGTVCEILIREKQTEVAKSVVKAVIAELNRLENKYSFYKTESLLSRINQESYNANIELDDETSYIFNVASDLHDLTNGLFDPTIGVINRCWDFYNMVLPSKEIIQGKLETVGWNKVEINNNVLRTHHPNMEIDLGGIVKEYSLDRCANLLEVMGVSNGLINLGGDVKVIGDLSNSNRPWRIGIADPRNHNQTIGSILSKKGVSVTSGDYQKYFKRDGKIYHHIINPKTGYPIPLEYSSVTILCDEAVYASKLATAILLGNKNLMRAESDFGYVVCDTRGVPIHRKDFDDNQIMLR